MKKQAFEIIFTGVSISCMRIQYYTYTTLMRYEQNVVSAYRQMYPVKVVSAYRQMYPVKVVSAYRKMYPVRV